jgi:hypothetical protein
MKKVIWVMLLFAPLLLPVTMLAETTLKLCEVQVSRGDEKVKAAIEKSYRGGADAPADADPVT